MGNNLLKRDNLDSSRRDSRVLDAASGKNHDEVLPVGSSPRFKSKFFSK